MSHPPRQLSEQPVTQNNTQSAVLGWCVKIDKNPCAAGRKLC
jgi:hypothetical protein